MHFGSRGGDRRKESPMETWQVIGVGVLMLLAVASGLLIGWAIGEALSAAWTFLKGVK